MKIILLLTIVLLSVAASLSQVNSRKTFQEALAQRQIKIEDVCNLRSHVQQKVMEEYGSLFVATGVKTPPKCILTEETTDRFQDTLAISLVRIGGKIFPFQSEAAKSLQMVVDELPRLGVNPLNFPREFGSPERNDPIVLRYNGNKTNINEDWGFRDYNQTVRNWGGKDKSKDEAVLAQLEYDRDRRPDKETPKMRGLAVPGASQHLAMIAFDLNKVTCRNADVIDLLQKKGWWRTIRDDNCHFTYLGWKDTQSLLANGLMKVTCRRNEGPVGRRVEIARDFWVPNLEEYTFIWYTGWLCDGDTLLPDGND